MRKDFSQVLNSPRALFSITILMGNWLSDIVENVQNNKDCIKVNP
jgi:hypothetical protein